MSDSDVTAGALLVTEYEALKREQAARIGTRDNLVYATLAAMGLVVAAGLREHSPASLFLLLPPVVLVLGWARTANDIKVTHIARYLRCDVAPRFAALTGQPALGWEQAHRADAGRAVRMVCQTAADLVLFVAAPLAALGGYWLGGPWTPLLLAVSLAEVLLVAGLAAVITVYSGVFDRPARKGRANRPADAARAGGETRRLCWFSRRIITRPDAHPAKNVRRVGAPNHLQGSGENPMVGTSGTGHDGAVREIQELRTANAALRGVNAELRRELDAADDSISELRHDLDAAHEGLPVGGDA